MTSPIIVAAWLGDEDQAWLDRLRAEQFPPERNQLAAHLTMFHHLPPSAEGELKQRLAEEAKASTPEASLSELMSLGRGVALRVRSPGLEAIRARLRDGFAGLLTPQDAGGWRPHVTIQNKVTPDKARETLARLQAGFHPRPLRIRGLAAHWYRGGPWEPLARYPFRG